MSSKNSAAIASRAVLRDAINRLRYIRQHCGKDDEDGQGQESTGDPFRDKIIQFTRSTRGLREMIMERNTSQQKKEGTASDFARDSHDVNVGFRDLNNDLREIKQMVDDADKELARANRKKKSEDKIRAIEGIVKERQKGYENCKD